MSAKVLIRSTFDILINLANGLAANIVAIIKKLTTTLILNNILFHLGT